MSTSTHLVTRDFINEILVSCNLFHLLGGILRSKPQCGGYTRNRVHFKPEVYKTHIMDHILCVDHQLNRFANNKVHFSCFDVIMAGTIFPVNTKGIAV